MSITINNTTVSSRLTVIFDSSPNKDNTNDGPVYGTGNTESDVYIDDKVYKNIRSHTEIPSEVHALQCWNKSGTWTYELEYTDNRENTVYASQSDLPTWVNNVVIRCEAQDVFDSAGLANINAQGLAWTDAGNSGDTFVPNYDTADSNAATERNSYLSAHSITY